MHWIDTFGVLALVLATGCRPAGAQSAPRATSPPRPASSEQVPYSSSSSPLEKTPIDERAPTLTIVSSYPVRQFVFVDANPWGEVAAAGTATFTVPTGRHTVSCADSPDPTDNASAIEAIFDSGYGYTYRLVAE